MRPAQGRNQFQSSATIPPQASYTKKEETNSSPEDVCRQKRDEATRGNRPGSRRLPIVSTVRVKTFRRDTAGEPPGPPPVPPRFPASGFDLHTADMRDP